jgi:hypothetical protein
VILLDQVFVGKTFPIPPSMGANLKKKHFFNRLRLDHMYIATVVPQVLNEHFHNQILIHFLHVSETADPGYHSLQISTHLATSHGVFLRKKSIHNSRTEGKHFSSSYQYQ